MANIQTEISKIDSRKSAENKGFLLPYQLDWVFDENRFKLCEKSIRVGMTFAQEFSAVRDRLRGKGDYLHSSVTQGVALNFIRECDFWLQQYRVKGTSLGETDFVNELDNTTQRALYIEFPNKCRIVSFSSSPNAMRGFGGAVGLDEIAFHRNMADMIKGAGGRSLWGDPVAMWSSHNGVDSDFNRFIQQRRAEGDACKWSMHRITILDAVEQGLVETINRTRGTGFTRESFLIDCETAVGSREAFEEECLCNPRDRGRPAVSWFDIQTAQEEYDIYSVQLKGDAKAGDDIDPSVKAFIDENPFAGLARNKRYAGGLDIARTGHLSSLKILETDGKKHRLVMHVKFQKCKFSSQREAIRLAMLTLPGLTCSGDSTGLGMQMCEELADEFRYRFTCVNFGAFKLHLGGKLTGAFEDHRIIIPRHPEEIAYDIRAVKTEASGAKTIYTESKNPVNALSHCDFAWSLALAIADAEDGTGGDVIVVPAAPDPNPLITLPGYEQSDWSDFVIRDNWRF